MKIRRSIEAAAATVGLAAMGALAVPAIASAHNAPHTLKLTAVTVKSITFTETTFAEQQTDVSAGKTIGFSVVYVTQTGPSSGTVNVALDITGGLLYGKVTSTNKGKTSSGNVTGGTGAFKGATGTITANAISSTKMAITIIYS